MTTTTRTVEIINNEIDLLQEQREHLQDTRGMQALCQIEAIGEQIEELYEELDALEN